MIVSEEKAIELVRNILGELSEDEKSRIRKLVAMESPLASDPERLAEDIRQIRAANSRPDPMEEMAREIRGGVGFWRARELMRKFSPQSVSYIDEMVWEENFPEEAAVLAQASIVPRLKEEEAALYALLSERLELARKRKKGEKSYLSSSWQFTDMVGETHSVSLVLRYVIEWRLPDLDVKGNWASPSDDEVQAGAVGGIGPGDWEAQITTCLLTVDGQEL